MQCIHLDEQTSNPDGVFLRSVPLDSIQWFVMFINTILYRLKTQNVWYANLCLLYYIDIEFTWYLIKKNDCC